MGEMGGCLLCMDDDVDCRFSTFLSVVNTHFSFSSIYVFVNSPEIHKTQNNDEEKWLIYSKKPSSGDKQFALKLIYFGKFPEKRAKNPFISFSFLHINKFVVIFSCQRTAAISDTTQTITQSNLMATMTAGDVLKSFTSFVPAIGSKKPCHVDDTRKSRLATRINPNL